MTKKIIFVAILVVILVLWINGIIPMQIARVSATIYFNLNYSKAQMEYVDIEWARPFGSYVIKFKDKSNDVYGILIGPKYFPIMLGQGMHGFEEEYMEKYGE